MKKSIWLTLGLILSFVQPISAEIERITIKWTPGLCTVACADALKAALLNVPGVASVDINQPAAQAELRWKPNEKFSYVAVYAAMARIGLSVNENGARVRVRGTINHDDRGVTIVSIGDNTPFQLLGPIVPQKNRYVMQESPYTHPLSQDMRDRLLQGEQDQKVATVTGPLFEPEMSPPFPLMLTVENLSFSKAKNEDQNQ